MFHFIRRMPETFKASGNDGGRFWGEGDSDSSNINFIYLFISALKIASGVFFLSKDEYNPYFPTRTYTSAGCV